MATAPPATNILPPHKKSFDIGTRKSKLALAQTDLVVEALSKAFPGYEFNIKSKDTVADLDLTTALPKFVSKNLWTEEFEDMLAAGQLDLIVHSLKDVPTLLPTNCALAGMLAREDPRDVLVVKPGLPYKSLNELPAGSVVGTSSIRRTALLAMKYPHLKVQSVRGNIGTRLAKLDAKDSPFSSIILAAAGLLRIDLGHRITQYLDSKNSGMFYAVGQGTIGVEIRADDNTVLEMLNQVGDRETTLAALAERSLLRTLEGGCSAPLGVESEWIKQPDGISKLRMRSIVVSIDGSRSADAEIEGDVDNTGAAEAFGLEMAKELVAKGAGSILEEIKQNKVSS